MTVAFGGRRADLTLPTDIPVAAFLGELAGACGVPLDVQQPAPLHLSRPVAGPIPPSRTLAQAGVVDGDVLLLTERPVEAPRIVDDLGRAVSDVVERLPGRWNRRVAAAALRLAAGLVTAGGAGILALGWQRAGRPGPLLPAMVTAVLLGVAAAIARSNARSTAPRTGAKRDPTGAAPRTRGSMLLAAAPWGALAMAAGTGALGGGLARLTTVAAGGAGAALVALMVAVVDRASAPPALALAVAAGAAAAGAGAVAAGRGAEQAGSVLAVVVLACLLLLPRVAVRASGVLDLDDGALEDEVAGRVVQGRQLVAWLSAGLSVAYLVAATLLLVSTGMGGRVLALVGALALGLRARAHRLVAEAAAPITVAALTVAATAATAAVGAAGPVVAAGAAVATGLTLTAVAAGVPRSAPHPGLRKAVELLQLACLLAVVPAATVSTGALSAVRAAAANLVGGP